MTEPHTVTRAILDCIKADGFVFSICNYPPSLGGHVVFTAWRDAGTEVRPPNVEV